MPARLPVRAFLAGLVMASVAIAGAAWPSAAQVQRAPEASPSPPAIPLGALGDRDITIANRSAMSISEIYVSPSSIDAWGEDRLADAILEPGHTLRLRLGRLRDCGFDLLVVYEDASREERLAHNLCRTRQVAFDGKRRTQPQAVALQSHDIAITNQSGRAIQQVFVSAADAAQWGEDLLTQAISVGETGRVVFRGSCTADIRVVFENRSAEERRGIDLCRRASLLIEPGWTTSDDITPPPL